MRGILIDYLVRSFKVNAFIAKKDINLIIKKLKKKLNFAKVGICFVLI